MTDDYSDEIPLPLTQGNMRQPGLAEHNARIKAQREAKCAKVQRTITTEEAERLAVACGLPVIAAALRSLAAERDALQARVAELEARLELLMGPPPDKTKLRVGLIAAGISEKTADEILSSPTFNRAALEGKKDV